MLISGFGWSPPLHKLITHQLHICTLLCLTCCLGPHDSEHCDAGPPHSLETLQEFLQIDFQVFTVTFGSRHLVGALIYFSRSSICGCARQKNMPAVFIMVGKHSEITIMFCLWELLLRLQGLPYCCGPSPPTFHVSVFFVYSVIFNLR